MSDLFLLEKLDQVKALADPLRLRILDALKGHPLTTKQVAQRLGEKPTRLYHHVEVLEQAGLIQLVETRPNRGTVEKYYQAKANRFEIDQTMFQAGIPAEFVQGGLHKALYASLLDSTKAEIYATLDAQPNATAIEFSPVELYRFHIRTSPQKVQELGEMLRRWFEACEAANDPQGEVAYSYLALYYPLDKDQPGAVGENER